MIICYTFPETWCMTDVIIFHFGPFFALLSLNSLKNQNFTKMKKTPRDIILHTCTKNYDQMMYSSWDMVHDRYNYFLFWAIFCPFTPNSPKNQNFEKMKETPRDIIILHMCTKNYDQMINGSWDMVCDRWMDGWMEKVTCRRGCPT